MKATFQAAIESLMPPRAEDLAPREVELAASAAGMRRLPELLAAATSSAIAAPRTFGPVPAGTTSSVLGAGVVAFALIHARIPNASPPARRGGTSWLVRWAAHRARSMRWRARSRSPVSGWLPAASCSSSRAECAPPAGRADHGGRRGAAAPGEVSGRRETQVILEIRGNWPYFAHGSCAKQGETW